MEEALRRIANMKDGKLNLSNVGLTELPHLPDGLRSLLCENNPITYPSADILSQSLDDIKKMVTITPPTLTRSPIVY